MNSQQPLTQFIRETLGCGCPDELFRSIETSSDGETTSIRVGGRLLIHLCRFAQGVDEEFVIRQWLQRGRDERDGAGFNRLRLVLPASSREAVLRRRFDAECASDDRLHLHFIAAAEHARIWALCADRD
jgi:hypothetical protein